MSGPDAKMIKPEGVSMEGEGPAEKPDMATRAAMWYLKVRERFRKKSSCFDHRGILSK